MAPGPLKLLSARNRIQRELGEMFSHEPAMTVWRHPASGRHQLFRATNAAGRDLFVKLGDDLGREARFYRSYDGPGVVPFHESGHDDLIVLDHIGEAQTLHIAGRIAPQLGLVGLADLAALLSAIHRLAISTCDAASLTEALPSLERLSATQTTQFSPAVRWAVEAIQSDPALLEAYQFAQSRSGPIGWINADVKADNVLLVRDGIRLLDWELSGRGPLGHDLGAVIGSMLLMWLDAPSDVAIVGPSRSGDGSYNTAFAIARFRMEYQDFGGPGARLETEDLARWTTAWLLGRLLAEASRRTSATERMKSHLDLAGSVSTSPQVFLAPVPL